MAELIPDKSEFERKLDLLRQTIDERQGEFEALQQTVREHEEALARL